MRIKLTRQLVHSPRGTLPLAVELDPNAASWFVHGLITDNGGRCKQGREMRAGPPGRCGGAGAEERPTSFGGRRRGV